MTTRVARVGSYHAVTPGPPGGEPAFYTGRHDEADLGSMAEAMSQAKFWSVSGPRQEVSVTRGKVTRVFRVYEHGQDVTARQAVLAPAAGPPAPEPGQVTVIKFEARRTRKPRGSINTPPCDTAGDDQPTAG